MERKPKTSRPSFFKVLFQDESDDFITRLRPPPYFVQKYGQFLPESAKLRCSSGETWDVKLDQETDDDEKYWCFIGGWRKFVKDLELKFGEFLVFWFNVGESTFDVSVYGTHCCEREVSAMAVESDADEDFDLSNDCHNVPDVRKKRPRTDREPKSCNNVPGERSYGSGEDLSGMKRFEAIVKNYNRFFMDIPKAFALETGIATKRAIKLQNEQGKEWVVELPFIKDGRIRMIKGWNDFFEENKVVFGSTCLFEFDANSGNLIMKKERDITAVSSSKRHREGPSESIIVPTKRERRTPLNNIIVPTKRGRGRPPKSIIVPTERGRGRGRPPKSIIVPTERGRGRPPKSSIVPMKRWGRGRPPKSIIVLTKRGRGRPPNNKELQVDRTRGTGDSNIEAESEYEFDSTDKKTTGSGDGEIWSFFKKLTKDHASQLEIPRYFALDTGIVRNRKLKLRDAKGKKWPIYVSAKACGKFAMTAGWNEFLTGNGVVVGSTICFEFESSSSNIIKAKVVKKGSEDGELFSYAKKGSGRPPKFQN